MTITLARLLLISAFLVPLSGCGQPNASPETAKALTPPTVPPDDTYQTRAIIEQLPIPGKPSTQFRAHHEAVDNFRSNEGKVVGMSAMVMDFPPARGVSLDGFKVGDKVRITWSVWWNNTPAWLLMKIEKLPDDTKIEFRKANPSAAPSAPK